MKLFLHDVASYTRWCTNEDAPPSPFIVSRFQVQGTCKCRCRHFWTFVALSLN